MATGPTPSKDHVRHTGFPQDGRLRWVRWLDRIDIEGGGTGTARLLVTFGLLPPDADLAAPPSLASLIPPGPDLGPGGSATVHAGDIPALSPGMVVRDGMRAGWLALEERSFEFDRRTAEESPPTACSGDNPAERPAFWDPDKRWKVLQERVYPLGPFEHSRCVVIHAGLRQLVLPCMEVFRFFYAPETLTALALTSGPWGLVKDGLLNGTYTDKRGDGSWQVGLRAGLTGRSAVALANMALCGFGRAAAERLFFTLPKTSRIAIGPTALGMIEAAIPYDWSRMRIKVRGVQLYPHLRGDGTLDKFLGLSISEVSWPVPPRGVPGEVHYRLDNNNVEGGDPPPGDPRPGGAVRRAVLGPDGKLRVSATVPPSIGSEPTFVEVGPPPILGGPVAVRMPLEPASPADGRPRPRASEPVDHASTGRERSGDTGAATLRYALGGEGAEAEPSRFAALAAMLEALRLERSIDAWTPVRPGPYQVTWRDGLPAWLFPAYDPSTSAALRWSALERRVYRRRAALVVRIAVGVRFLHWVEIEERSTEAQSGFRALLFTTGAADVGPIVESLLLHAAREEGVWPRTAGELTGAPPDAWGAAGLWLAPRRHPYNLRDLAKKTGDDGRREYNLALSRGAIMAGIAQGHKGVPPS